MSGPSTQKKNIMKQKNKQEKGKQSQKRNFWEGFAYYSQNKIVIAILVVIVSFIFGSNYSSIYDKKVDLNGDNIYYYSLGKALSQGDGYSNIINLEKTPHNHFPPGYPFFISKLIKVFPDDIQTVKKANGVLLYLSVILLFFIINATTKNSILAFCASVLMSMHKELLHFATIMMSETLFIFLSLLSIYLAILLVQGKIGKKRPWVAWIFIVLYGLLIAYTYFVRTMGLSLILALAGWLGIFAVASLIRWRKAVKREETEMAVAYRQQLWRSAVLCVLTVVAVGTAKFSWDTRNKNLGFTGSDYENTFFKKTNNETMQGVEDWKARIKSNTSNFITQWIPQATYMKDPVDKDHKNTTGEWISGSLLLAVMIAGCLYMSTGRLLMLFYMGLTVGVLILYPEQYGGLRYITPIMPLFIFLLLNGIAACIWGIFKIFKVTIPPLLLQSIVILLITFINLTPKYAAAQKTYHDNARMTSWFSIKDINAKYYLEASRYLDSIQGPVRPICRKPELTYIFSNFHACNGFPQYAEPDTIYNILRRDSINYLIVDNWFRHAYVTLFPCIQKYPDKFKLVKQYGEADTAKKINPTYIFFFNDEWGYTGDMKDGVREGKGVLKMQDGRKYEGEFQNNLPNGLGTLYDTAGVKLVTGYWKDGALTRYMRP